MGGRGAGKTRAGAEWVRAKALGLEPLGEVAASRIALVGETMAEVRRVMIEGVSGLLGIHGIGERPRFEPSKLQLVWPSGAIAQMFSAENPEALRGPQFDAAWCDEIAKWRRPQRAWDMLQFGLRLGRRPQMVVTTTPRPIPLLKKLIADAATVVTRAATASNAENLAPTFIAEMTRRYAGTALGPAMTDTTTATPAPQSKWWGQSVTIWGALITALSTVLPALGPALGIDITTDLVRELGGEVVQTIQAVGALIGTILTIYGRARHAAARATRDDREILSAQLRQTHSRRVQAPLAREARCCRLRLPSRESLPLPLRSCLPAPPLPPPLRAPGPATRIGRMRPQS